MLQMATSSMRHFLKYRSLVIAACVCAFAGCKSNSTVPAAPAPTGSLSGRVQLYSGTGNMIVIDTGVTVSVSGLNVTANTNDSGQWILSGLPIGSYTITFTKSGFGTVELFSDSVSTNDTTKVLTVVMSEPPTDDVAIQNFGIIAPASLEFTCSMPPPKSSFRTVVFCFSTDSASLAANPNQAPWTLACAAEGNAYDGTFSVSTDTTVNLDSLAAGSRLFATACIVGEGTNYQSFSSYYDPVAKREVYSALGPASNIVFVTVP